MAVADVVIKQEAVDAVDLEERIVHLCKENPKGVTDQAVQHDMPSIPPQQRVTAINRLLSTGRIELFKSGNQLLYRYKDTQAAQKTKGFDLEEKLVYQIIEESGNKGIWIRDIRYKCNLQLTQVNKILKNLESKKLVKAVKSVAASKKKVYMLFNVEPDISVTGGAWYSDQDFESEFVEVLNQQCYKYLQQKAEQAGRMKVDPLARKNASYAPSSDVWKFITELGISKVQLSVSDIETILDTLLFDGKVEKILVADTTSSRSATSGQKKLFRAVSPLAEPTALVKTPCGVCPVIKALMRRFVKKDVLNAASDEKLTKLDVTDFKNHVDYKRIDVGFASEKLKGTAAGKPSERVNRKRLVTLLREGMEK